MLTFGIASVVWNPDKTLGNSSEMIHHGDTECTEIRRERRTDKNSERVFRHGWTRIKHRLGQRLLVLFDNAEPGSNLFSGRWLGMLLSAVLFHVSFASLRSEKLFLKLSKLRVLCVSVVQHLLVLLHHEVKESHEKSIITKPIFAVIPACRPSLS
ncbi:MAG: hypothetical protein V4719_08290 [Planctomycetota bacterium]